MNPFLFVLVLLLLTLELCTEHRRDWRARGFDVLRTGLLWSLAVLAGIAATLVAALTLYAHLGWHNPLPYPIQLLLGFLLADYAWYAFHRVCHGPGWRLHAWHHVPTRLNVWMTHIGHPAFNFLAALVRLVPLLLAGLDPSIVTAVGVIQLLWTMAAHLNVPISTPSLNRWLITPQVHRWHHAPGARVNLGLCLTLWDRLHGTYACPTAGPSSVGVRTPERYPHENALLAHLAYPLARGGDGGDTSAAPRRPPPRPKTSL